MHYVDVKNAAAWTDNIFERSMGPGSPSRIDAPLASGPVRDMAKEALDKMDSVFSNFWGPSLSWFEKEGQNPLKSKAQEQGG